MNNGQRRFLVSTAEDNLYNHITDHIRLGDYLRATAQEHGIEMQEAEINELLREAILNYARGKRTRVRSLFGWLAEI